MSVTTSLTRILDIQHPILLAGMGQASGAALAAAVSNAGGLGVIGGVGYTPEMLKEMIKELKEKLKDPKLPFGVDLLLPQVGGSARKTNVRAHMGLDPVPNSSITSLNKSKYDYTKGNLDTLVDIIIEGGTKLFVSAVGIPPRHVIQRLHSAGVLYMNMVGHPKHVHKACQAGADIICAQGGEAGGHTGSIPFSILIPACADICKQYSSRLTGEPVQLVAAGGVFDGRSLAAALMLGATGVWVGTRFIPALESGAPETAKSQVVESGFDDTIVTTIASGRPLRMRSTPYIANWEKNRQDEIKSLTSRGVLPLEHDLDRLQKEGRLTEEIEEEAIVRPMGIVAGMVTQLNQPAAEIVQNMAREAYELLQSSGRQSSQPKL